MSHGKFWGNHPQPVSAQDAALSSGRASIGGPSSPAETQRVAAFLRKEVVGGVLLLAAMVIARGWANSP